MRNRISTRVVTAIVGMSVTVPASAAEVYLCPVQGMAQPFMITVKRETKTVKTEFHGNTTNVLCTQVFIDGHTSALYVGENKDYCGMFGIPDDHVKQTVTFSPTEISAHGDGPAQGYSGFTLDLESGVASWESGTTMICHRSHL
jgi:hypothetical protein